MRAFVRYLIFLGVAQDSLHGAIPQKPRWRHVALPRHLPQSDVDRVVAGALDGTTRGRRNYSILLLLARTGLRAHEVAQLSLDDIDRREGIINIRSKKSRNERRLPLVHDVGAALVDYLEHCRPSCSSRTIFLRVIPPFRPFLGSGGICRVVRRALTRVGLLNTPSAAHLFRHTAATRMLRGGASFKEIADVLGHAAISTTAIYAKLDTAGLSRVAITQRRGLHLKQAAACANCPSLEAKRIHPHAIRHTTGSHLLQSGVDISVIALWLGHESVQTTHVYVEADLAAKQRALSKLEPVGMNVRRYKPQDQVLAFLATL
jgi:site-specific recombinase XerD